MKNHKLLITHDGRFHSDDLFSYVVLSKIFPNHTLERTREPEQIAKGDIVFDIGGKYDPARGHFDHHQENPPKRSITASYSSIGLIWKEWGARYVELVCPGSQTEKIVQEIDYALIAAIDGADCGEQKWPDNETIFCFNRTWLEKENTVATFQKTAQIIGKWLEELTNHVGDAVSKGASPAFGVRFARLRDIPEVKHRVRAEGKARQAAISVLESCAKKAAESKNTKVLELPHFSLPWQQIIHTIPSCNAAEFCIFETQNKDWVLVCVPKPDEAFVPKKELPQAWAGKHDAEMEQVTGVKGAKFCHNKQFICGAKTKEGIKKLLALAMAEHENKSSE